MRIALGWTLLHSLWEGLVIAAALAAVLALVRSPRIRYVAACSGMLAMVAAFAITLVHLLPETNGGGNVLIRTNLPAWRELPGLNAGHSIFPDFAALVPWLAPLWLVGVCVFYLRYAAGCLSVRRLRGRGACKASDCWQRSVARLAGELKISRPVALLESLLAETPAVLGHFRPVILVPLGFMASLPPDQVEAILLHELAHISRADYLVNILPAACRRTVFLSPGGVVDL